MMHGSLFSGIGGFDYAASLLGWGNVFQCEIDPFCQRVLKYHFPKCELFTDIKTTNFTKYANTIDVISGGFPCQPFSVAGKRRGTEDNRFLWDEMLRAIQEISPNWVVAENVSGLLTQEHGVVFERVCADLENAGYEVQAFVIPACAVNAPHRRDRIWIIAHSENNRWRKRRSNGGGEEHNTTERTNIFRFSERFGEEQITSNTESTGQTARITGQRQIQSWGRNERMELSDYWANFPTQPPVCLRNDGFSAELFDITFSKWRRESIKSLGNGIVPQVALEIFKVIEIIEQI